MAKRFTDTCKWKDSWFQDLPTKYKLFWVYLLDDCDAAGLWKPNVRLACFQIGEPFEEAELKRVFSERIDITESGYWFIKKFIIFQYGELSEACHPHKSIIKLLKSHKIKGYWKGTNTLQEQEQEQEQEKVKEKEQVKEQESSEIFPIEDCIRIAIFDTRFTKANKTNEDELILFNGYLERQGKYQMNPADYKKYFAKLKGKYPAMIKKEYSIDELREMAKKMDEQKN
jgi:hypothetical protein